MQLVYLQPRYIQHTSYQCHESFQYISHLHIHHISISNIHAIHHFNIPTISGGQNSSLVRVSDSRLKGCEFKSQVKWQENFLLQLTCVLTLFRCLFHPHVTAVACKRLWPFCQKCRRQFTSKHTYTFDLLQSEWADYAAVQA